MSSKKHFRFASTALIAAMALANGSLVLAQANGPPSGSGRPTNERILTQTPTPPPVNSDALRAAEGQLPPGVPTTNGAIDPARPASAADRMAMDLALLIHHAVGMAIEGSSLRTIADQTFDLGGDAMVGRILLDHANRSVAESEKLLGKAAADGAALPSNPVTRRFHSAANAYISTLVSLEKARPTQKAQMALINHAVKESLDANLILRMSPASGGRATIEQLLRHAGAMKNDGTQTLSQMSGNAKIELNSPATTSILALRGRELIDAAEQIGPFFTSVATVPANPVIGLPPGPNPGLFQDDRPLIIGGTYGTGSPGTGTTRTVPPFSKEALSKINKDGSPIPTPPNGDTSGSTGGLSPR